MKKLIFKNGNQKMEVSVGRIGKMTAPIDEETTITMMNAAGWTLWRTLGR